MIITLKIKHNFALSDEFDKAKLVANFAINNRDKLSSANVKDIGLKSAISNQILRKYGKNFSCKKISKQPNLIIPGQSLKILNNKLHLIPLKLELDISRLPGFIRVNQVELSKNFAFLSVEISEKLAFQPTSYVGLDRNANGHVAVLANPLNGKILKLGSSCLHIREKYRKARAKAQKSKSFRLAKKLAKREARIIQDINHKISKAIIDYCIINNCGLILEDLKGITKKDKGGKLNGILHTWTFYQLERFLAYKALRAGVPILKINPAYTSQECSRCGELGERQGKIFECRKCKHHDHADVNAAFNIAKRVDANGHSCIDRDIQVEPRCRRLKKKGVSTTGKAQLGNGSCVS